MADEQRTGASAHPPPRRPLPRSWWWVLVAVVIASAAVLAVEFVVLRQPDLAPLPVPVVQDG